MAIGTAAVYLTLGTLLGRAQASLPQSVVTVAGEVITERDQMISFGVTVSVESAEGRPMAQESANSQGRFQIDLPSGRKPYRLTVRAEGYYPILQDLDLRGTNGTVAVRVVLTRASKGGPAGQASSVTDQNAPRKARQVFEKGVKALNAGRLSDAQRDFAEAVREYPCYARAQNWLAAVLITRRDLSTAEAALHKAIQCDAAFPEAFVSLGRLLNSEKRFGESATALQQGIRLSPGRWELYDQLAAAHYSQGQYGQASEEWERAAELNPHRPSSTPSWPPPTSSRAIPPRLTRRCRLTCAPIPRVASPPRPKA